MPESIRIFNINMEIWEDLRDLRIDKLQVGTSSSCVSSCSLIFINTIIIMK